MDDVGDAHIARPQAVGIILISRADPTSPVFMPTSFHTLNGGRYRELHRIVVSDVVCMAE
jgi:hypothetical protein